MDDQSHAQTMLYKDVWLMGGARTPFADFNGTLRDVSATDLGIKAAREALKATLTGPEKIDAVVASSVAQTSFDAFFLARHIGLYAGVPIGVPALVVQRLCTSGFEAILQAADQQVSLRLCEKRSCLRVIWQDLPDDQRKGNRDQSLEQENPLPSSDTRSAVQLLNSEGQKS